VDGVKVDAHQAAINALAGAGFVEIRGRLDRTAAGLQQIVTLLTDGRPVVQ